MAAGDIQIHLQGISQPLCNTFAYLLPPRLWTVLSPPVMSAAITWKSGLTSSSNVVISFFSPIRRQSKKWESNEVTVRLCASFVYNCRFGATERNMPLTEGVVYIVQCINFSFGQARNIDWTGGMVYVL